MKSGSALTILFGLVLIWSLRATDLQLEHGSLFDAIFGFLFSFFWVGVLVMAINNCWGKDLK